MISTNFTSPKVSEIWNNFEISLWRHFLYDFFGFSPETQKVVKYIKILKIRQTKKFKNE